MSAVFEERGSPDRIQTDPEDRRRFQGRAIVFNSLSAVLMDHYVGPFKEIINPAAVDRTLRDATHVKALWNHNADLVLGSVRAGTLRLMKTGSGLFVNVLPPSWASAQMESVERGDVDGMSFKFRAVDDQWSKTDDGFPLREVTDMEFSEVSIVAFPAYPETNVGLAQRSIDGYHEVFIKGMSVDFARKLHQTRMAR